MKPTLVITGASSGIGREIALAGHAAGYPLLLIGRDEVRLREVSRDCGDATWHSQDLTDENAPTQVAALVQGPAILVNNAGVFHYGAFATESRQAIEQMIAVNLTAPILLTQALMPNIRAGGQLVNILSVAATVAFEGSAVYGATKAGLAHWAAALRTEYPDLVIHNLFPGPVDTPMWDKVSLQVDAKQDPKEIADEVIRLISQ